MSDWLDRLECDAPNLVGSFRALDDGRFIALRREVRRLAGAGSAVRLAREHAAVVPHLDGLIAAPSPEVLAAPGGEEDWNVAQALGHATAARQGLVLAAQMAALGRWPAEGPTVVPGVPGPPDADSDALRERLAKSQRFIERAAERIAGHELEPCPLDHPLVGRLRCGEWLLFARVHGPPPVEQTERPGAPARGRRGAG